MPTRPARRDRQRRRCAPTPTARRRHVPGGLEDRRRHRRRRRRAEPVLHHERARLPHRPVQGRAVRALDRRAGGRRTVRPRQRGRALGDLRRQARRDAESRQRSAADDPAGDPAATCATCGSRSTSRGFFVNPTSCAEKRVTGVIELDAWTRPPCRLRSRSASARASPFRPRMVGDASAAEGTRARDRTTPLTATVDDARGARRTCDP